MLADSERGYFNEKCSKLRDQLTNRILKLIPGSFLNGHPTDRLSNIVNISFDGVEGEPILVGLDFAGIYASSGSASSSGSLDPSHVLIATGLNPRLAVGSIRFSFSPSNSEEEIDYVVKELSKIAFNDKNILKKLEGLIHPKLSSKREKIIRRGNINYKRTI